MKRIINFSLFVILITASVISCNKQSFWNDKITGKEFAKFGLENISYSSALDSAGKWHNDYQGFMLTEIYRNNIQFLDTTNFKNFIKEKSKHFFIKKGIQFSDQISELNLGRQSDLELKFNKTNFSNDANEIINELFITLKNFKEYNKEFENKLFKLKSRTLNLNNDTEIFEVGIPISIAIYSYKYWSENGDRWIEVLSPNVSRKIKLMSRSTDENLIFYETEDIDLGFSQLDKKICSINLWKIGGADVSGGISGAISGAALGPGGAFAGGVLTSSIASLGNLSNQVISCKVSWWPF